MTLGFSAPSCLSCLSCCYSTDSSQEIVLLERLREISITNTQTSLRAATHRLKQARRVKQSLERAQAIRNIYLTQYDKARKELMEQEICRTERKIELAKSAMTAAYIKLYKLRMGGT